MIVQNTIEVSNSGRGFTNISANINAYLENVPRGICNIFTQHTSCALIICENADPDVLRDVATFFDGLVPDGMARYLHNAEGPDDMPAHIKSILNHTDLTIPVKDNALMLGTWQGVYLYEHRTRPYTRKIVLTTYC